MVYDSRVGLLDLKTLRSKDELDSNKVSKIIDYIKALRNSAADRNTINKDNYIYSTLLNFLFQEVLRFRMMF